MSAAHDLFGWIGGGFFAPIDVCFADFMRRLDGRNERGIFLAAALVSHATRSGHVCLDLAAVAESTPAEVPDGQGGTPDCPPLASWRTTLRSSRVVGHPGEFRPLILDDRDRLYLYRYFDYEQRLAEAIRKRTQAADFQADDPLLQEGLQRYFPEQPEGTDWRKIAALAAVLKPFCVISGGPGTGKTYLIARILALLLEQHPEPLAIQLAAPTGKAAARLRETIQQAKASLPCPEAIRSAIPSQTCTVHRLLKTIHASPYFRHNADHPLPADVVVLDEASMVDLALMAKLFDAISPQARLILLGDHEQLVPVESGSVLGDICRRDSVNGFSASFRRQAARLAGERLDSCRNGRPAVSGLQDSIVVLKKSYRFAADGPIARLSLALNRRSSESAMALLARSHPGELAFRELPAPGEMLHELAQAVAAGYRGYLEAANPEEALNRLNHFMILCATRTGPYGVIALNQMVEQVLRRSGRIRPDPALSGSCYPGRPVLVTRNDYELELFNGDLGTVRTADDAPGSGVFVFFQDPGGGLRRIEPDRLPENETAFAMTVHKSQGSEFDHVLLILPDRDLPLLTCELVYTSVTRARKSVTIWAREAVFRAAVARESARRSGLRDALWGSCDSPTNEPGEIDEKNRDSRHRPLCTAPRGDQ